MSRLRLWMWVVICGAVGAAVAAWLPFAETRPVYVPIDLRAGATTAVDFVVERDVQYEIGVEMERQTAERLFPCTAGEDFHGPIEQCHGARLPVSLQIALTENGVDRSAIIEPDTAESGGSYVYAGSRQTYTWWAAYARLKPSRHYHMVVRSLVDGSAVAVAGPRLTVEVSPIDTEGEVVLRFLGFWAAVAIGGLGILWGAASYLLHRLRR